MLASKATSQGHLWTLRVSVTDGAMAPAQDPGVGASLHRRHRHGQSRSPQYILVFSSVQGPSPISN